MLNRHPEVLHAQARGAGRCLAGRCLAMKVKAAKTSRHNLAETQHHNMHRGEYVQSHLRALSKRWGSSGPNREHRVNTVQRFPQTGRPTCHTSAHAVWQIIGSSVPARRALRSKIPPDISSAVAPPSVWFSATSFAHACCYPSWVLRWRCRCLPFFQAGFCPVV